MKRTVLVVTITTTLAAAATAATLASIPLFAGKAHGVEPSASADTKAMDVKPAANPEGPERSSGTAVADSGRLPVPIVRKPNPPAAAEGPPLSDRSIDTSYADAPVPPDLPPPPSDRTMAMRSPETYTGPPAVPWRDDRITERVVISRGYQSDYVVIPVDRHVVVIRGWRGGKEGKRDRRRDD